MKRSLYLILTIILMGGLSGCASMSKKECLNANWESVGYNDGSRGIHYTQLEKHRQSCMEYEVIPDDAAYRHGWEQGIRRYCTADNGYRTGQAGNAYRNICPADVADDYISGWEQGIAQYCTADNGLRQGLAGRAYNGACPPDLEPAFHDFYRLGHDVRAARAAHQETEHRVDDLQRRLAAETDAGRHRDLLHELERLQHEENRRDAILIALEACISDDWFDAGYRDGEDGYPRRAGEIAGVCRNYGIGADIAGYRQGWLQGNSRYCTYETGLYLGQTNQLYSGVCAGQWHQHFWQGYERGRRIYQSGRYEAHPRPAKRVIQAPDVRRKVLPPHAAPKKPVRRDEMRPLPEKKRVDDGRKYKAPATIVKQLRDKRDRETVRPPAKKGVKAPPVKKEERTVKTPNDNRDKLKHPMPEKSRKTDLEKEKDGQGDGVRKDDMRKEPPKAGMMKMQGM